MGGSADAGVMTRSCEAQSAPSATNALVIAIFASRRRDDGLDWAGAPGRELYRSALPSDRLCLYALRVSRQSLSTLSSDFRVISFGWSSLIFTKIGLVYVSTIDELLCRVGRVALAAPSERGKETTHQQAR